MKTICLEPVTPPLLTTHHRGSGDVAARHVEHYRSCPCLGDTDTCCVPSCCPPFLSFVTVDRPPPIAACNCRGYAIGSYHSLDCATFGPSPWIGQRVAIYAKPIAKSGLSWNDERVDLLHGAVIDSDAIVGSGTLAEALPIYDTGWPNTSFIQVHQPGESVTIWRDEGNGQWSREPLFDVYRLQDWSAGRWALRFTDVAPTSERCPWCGTRRRWYEAEAWPGEIFNCIICCDDGYTSPVVAPVLSGDDPTYKEWTP